MKKFILFLLPVIIASCSYFMLQEKGSIKLENGEGKKVSVPYEIFDFKKVEKYLNKAEFDKIVPEASYKAKETCKYPLTYEPKKIQLYMDNETTVISIYYSAKNGFGVPGELHSFVKFKGTSFQEINVPSE